MSHAQLLVNSATMPDAIDFRRKLSAETNGELPCALSVEDKLADGEALIVLSLTGGLFRKGRFEVDALDLPKAEA